MPVNLTIEGHPPAELVGNAFRRCERLLRSHTRHPDAAKLKATLLWPEPDCGPEWDEHYEPREAEAWHCSWEYTDGDGDFDCGSFDLAERPQRR